MMRILFLSYEIPYPVDTGGRLRVSNLLSALVDHHEVVFVAPGDLQAAEGWPLAASLRCHPIPTGRDRGPIADGPGADPGRRGGSWKPWFGLPESMRHYDLPGLWRHINGLPLDEFDVFHAQTIAFTPYAFHARRLNRRLTLTADMHDVPSILWAREFAAQPKRLIGRRRLWCWIEVERLRRIERVLLPHFDRLTVCSEVDKAAFSEYLDADRISVVPNGVEVGRFSDIAAPARTSRLMFAGSMDYRPNVTAAVHFCDRILPLIRERVPDAEFWIVGRNPVPPVRDLAGRPGVHVTGEVPSMKPYWEQGAIAVVPLLSGGGTRLKILEAMACGRPVVSTTIGAEGLAVTPGDDIILADDHRDFATACVGLLRDDRSRRDIGESARRLVEARYDWSVARERFRDVFESLGHRRSEMAQNV